MIASIKNKKSIWQLAVIFLKLGSTAFGGPAAHIAMMRDEVVERLKWLSDTEFLDLLAATNLIPGPNSTEMAIHLGFKRAGLPGLIVAGFCFILPACVIVGIIAWCYERFDNTPQISWLTYGISPVIIAIILQAIWKLARSGITNYLHATIGITIALLSLSGINELFLLMVGGLVVLVPHLIGRTTIAILLSGLSSITISAYTTTIATTAIVPVTMTRLTLFFLKVGSVLFGSGYVLLAFLRGDLVQRWGWLTDQQLLDAITIGQITPGPVFTTATFLGYLLGGWSGAILATIGIFMPGFIFVTLTQPLIPRLRTSAIASHLLDGVVVSSLGLMGAVTYHLSLSSIVDIPTALIATVAAILLVIWQPNSTWLLIGGAMAGWLLKSDLG